MEILISAGLALAVMASTVAVGLVLYVVAWVVQRYFGDEVGSLTFIGLILLTMLTIGIHLSR